jgi:carboxylesterase
LSEGAALFEAAFRDPVHHPFTLRADADSPAALLVHGFPGSPAEMRALGGMLHADGWTVHALLLPGFGPEIATLERRRVEEWQAAVRQALRDLQARHSVTLLVGNSMGGALALDAAAACQPSGLALLNPFWKLDHALWKLLPVLKYVMPQFRPFRLVKLDFDDAETRRGMAAFMPGANLDDPRVRASIRQFAIPTRVFDQLRRAGKAGRAAAEQITMPTLIVQGERDSLVQPALTRALAAAMRADVRYHEVPGEHNLLDPLQSSWHAVKAAVTGFAAEIAAQAPLESDQPTMRSEGS